MQQQFWLTFVLAVAAFAHFLTSLPAPVPLPNDTHPSRQHAQCTSAPAPPSVCPSCNNTNIPRVMMLNYIRLNRCPPPSSPRARAHVRFKLPPVGALALIYVSQLQPDPPPDLRLTPAGRRARNKHKYARSEGAYNELVSLSAVSSSPPPSFGHF